MKETPTAKTGYILAILTTILWGSEPIIFEALLRQLSAETITWFRFGAAAIILALLSARSLATYRRPAASAVAIIAGIFLGLHYLGFMLGIQLLGPTRSTILIQSGVLFFAIMSVRFFRDPFQLQGILGFLIAIAGYGAYFYSAGAEGSDLILGSMMVVSCGLLWAIFASLQRALAPTTPQLTFLTIAFVGASLVFLPLHPIAELQAQPDVHWWVLLLIAGTTATAYSLFGYAVRMAPSTRIAAIVALNPLVTIAISRCLGEPMKISPLAVVLILVGTLCVVTQRHSIDALP